MIGDPSPPNSCSITSSSSSSLDESLWCDSLCSCDESQSLCVLLCESLDKLLCSSLLVESLLVELLDDSLLSCDESQSLCGLLDASLYSSPSLNESLNHLHSRIAHAHTKWIRKNNDACRSKRNENGRNDW